MAEQRLALRQERFTIHDPDAKPQRWQVPIACGPSRAGAGQRSRSCSMGRPRSSTGRCGEPVKLNLGDVGYYRVQYDAATAGGAGARRSRAMAPADRVNLLADSWALVEAGRERSCERSSN